MAMELDKPNDTHVAINDVSADTMEAAEGELSTSLDAVGQRPLAMVRESSIGVSEVSVSDDEDDDDDCNNSRTSSIHTAVSSTALTVIAMPTHILASKWAVALILVTSSCLLGWAAFIYTEGEERKDFLDELQDNANEIFEQSMNNILNTFVALSSFSETIVSLTLFSESSWPILTVPHFERRASDFLSISNVNKVALAPLVTYMHREEWEAYTVANQDWIQEGLDFDYMLTSASVALRKSKQEKVFKQANTTGGVRAKPIQEAIWRIDHTTGEFEVELTKGPHMPVWQTYPPPRNSSVVNYNLLGEPEFELLRDVAMRHRHPVLSGALSNSAFFGTGVDTGLNPQSVALQPVFESFEEDAPVVAFLVVSIGWDILFQNVLHNDVDPIICTISNSCGQIYSYEIVGGEAKYLGEGYLYDTQYSTLGIPWDLGFSKNASIFTSICNFTLTVYPTEVMEDNSLGQMPVYITAAVLTMFGFTTLIFLMYDLAVQKNQSTLAATAMTATSILGQLFPQEFHDRLFASSLAANDRAHLAPKYRMRESMMRESTISHDSRRRKKAINMDAERDALNKDAPIADLFPNCTVLFADVSGFTAWSSVREPSQVFQLLETLYSAFDSIATRRGVFKVETIGDTYLAVTGLPNPRDDHAVVMVRFASECLAKMADLTQSLELELGPGTGDLSMRFGLHSGPVTAGVLRGQKSRFQLFGDTVNTAARMESTGERDRIQVSQETANLLTEAGKEKWLLAREKKIEAKGKGELQTWWASPRGHVTGHHAPLIPSCMVSNARMDLIDLGLDEKRQRSVHWISEIMMRLLKQIVARRSASTGSAWHTKSRKTRAGSFIAQAAQFELDEDSKMVVDELKDVISLPKFDKALARKQGEISKVRLPEAVVEQLHSYISWVAQGYRDNPFHNMDHAAHVTMSVSKLLARIVAPETLDPAKESGKTFEARRHDHTYGITSDPLTQFSCVFAALIHDTDHPGCPNVSLVQEGNELALKYKNRSVAEQNSFDLCWSELMNDKYTDLRACIYSTDEDGARFRQLVVNSIIATDISDKTLSAQRKLRWNKAFHRSSTTTLEEETAKSQEDLASESLNRKATIVIEHLIQASDVAHTMQHWHIYQKWNEKLFEEMQKAYEANRLEKPPAESWYQGELGFYDFYIIPLAKKLKDCGVFGVSSDEYLNYATANREEWEARGKEIVAGYIRKYVKPPAMTRTGSKKKIGGKIRRSSLFGSLGSNNSSQNSH